MRIYDALSRLPMPPDEDASLFLDVLQEAVCFDVTNTFEYLASLEEPSRDQISIADMPCLVPPFRTTWLEYRVPGGLDSDIAKWHYGSHLDRFGVLLQTDDLWSDPYAKDFADGLLARMAEAKMALSANPRWMMSERDVLGRGYRIENLSFTRFWFLDETGRVVCNRDTGQIVNALIPYTNFVRSMDQWVNEEYVQHVNRHTHLAPLFAISLAHCKNVNVVDAADVRTRQQRRQDEREQRPPVAVFRTLEIDPMKRVLANEGGVERNGLKKALHICRGHFAHYTDDKPLFGKYTGTFWKPAHVRGTEQAGKVFKDYRVKAGAHV